MTDAEEHHSVLGELQIETPNYDEDPGRYMVACIYNRFDSSAVCNCLT